MGTDMVATRDARSRAAKIRDGIHNYLSTLASIAEAWKAEDWRHLGYENWQAYIDGEFGAARLRLTPEHRQKAVEELRLAGMSQRAIASAIGVPRETVRRHLPGDPNGSPDQITGTDGKAYAATRPTPPVPEFIPPPDLEDVVEEKPGTPVVEAMKTAIKETVKRTEKAEPGVVQAW